MRKRHRFAKAYDGAERGVTIVLADKFEVVAHRAVEVLLNLALRLATLRAWRSAAKATSRQITALASKPVVPCIS